MSESEITRDLNFDAQAARREEVFESFRRLLGEDPAVGPDDIKPWLEQVMFQIELLADITADSTLEANLRNEVVLMKTQSQALSGSRAPDLDAWKSLVGNTKDFMNTVLHGPEELEKAA